MGVHVLLAKLEETFALTGGAKAMTKKISTIVIHINLYKESQHPVS